MPQHAVRAARRPAAAKKPAWLNDPLNYHDRGDIDFGSCSQTCFEQGDFFGLDDLFTEKPNVDERAGADLLATGSRGTRSTASASTPRKHVNAAFFRLWVPKIRAAARAAGVDGLPDLRRGDARTTPSSCPTYVRDRGLPSVLDFPFQDVATRLRGRHVGRERRSPTGSPTTTTSARRTASTPTPPTFLGNHDMGRAALQIRAGAAAASTATRCSQRVLLGYDLLYLLRGAPAVYYGDEVGMIGRGGDQAARQDMFPTQVADWQTRGARRLAADRQGLVVRRDDNPIEARAASSSARCATRIPALSTGSSIVALREGRACSSSAGSTWRRKRELRRRASTTGTPPASVTVTTSTPSATWSQLHGSPVPFAAPRSDAAGVLTVPVSATTAVLLEAQTADPEPRAGRSRSSS